MNNKSYIAMDKSAWRNNAPVLSAISSQFSQMTLSNQYFS